MHDIIKLLKEHVHVNWCLSYLAYAGFSQLILGAIFKLIYDIKMYI